MSKNNMKLLIGVATYKRIDKLKRLLNSLKNQTHQDFIIHVVCDNNDIDSYNYLKSIKLSCSLNNKHKFVIGAWNKTVQDYMHSTISFDGFIGLVDDVELRPNALEEIVKCHKLNFPDTDGICGFKQECYGNERYTFKWYGQTLMGRKFIERYKEVDYKICCPDYFHFYQDEEMHEYASSLNKFICCETAILDHDHPGFTGSVDEAHNTIRKGNLCPKNLDIQMYKQRKNKFYLWGREFSLVGKNG